MFLGSLQEQEGKDVMHRLKTTVQHAGYCCSTTGKMVHVEDRHANQFQDQNVYIDIKQDTTVHGSNTKFTVNTKQSVYSSCLSRTIFIQVPACDTLGDTSA